MSHRNEKAAPVGGTKTLLQSVTRAARLGGSIAHCYSLSYTREIDVSTASAVETPKSKTGPAQWGLRSPVANYTLILRARNGRVKSTAFTTVS